MKRKDRRHSGRITPEIHKGTDVKEMIKECLEPQPRWNDWFDYRDGFRARDIEGVPLDKTKQKNMKNKKLLDIRKAMKRIKDTGKPFCTMCDKDFEQETEHTWKPTCKCNKKEVRLMWG